MRCLFHAGLSLIVLASYGAERCVAHQKWLGPNVFVAEKAPVLVSFDVTWSDQPFTAESGVGDQPIEVIGPNGERIAPWQVFVGKTKTTAEVELSKPGTYRLQAVDSLTYWTRVERDGQQQWLKKPKNEVTGAKITRSDLYWSKAMAYVTVGQPTETPPPHDSEPLDIVLDMHPSKLFVGSEFAMRVVSYGKPVPSAEMKVFGANTTGHEPSQTVQCDKEGIGRLQVDSPGRYLVACQLEHEVPDDPKADISIALTCISRYGSNPVASDRDATMSVPRAICRTICAFNPLRVGPP